MSEFIENNQLKILQSVFKDYCEYEKDYILKINIFKFFFEYKIIDTCGYNIFQINEFLHQLSPETDNINLKMFLTLIFYIYKTQNLSDEEKSNTSVDQIKPNDINKICADRQIYSSTNIIKIILNQKDRREQYFSFEEPDFDHPDIKSICEYETLNFLSNYMKSIEKNIFEVYSTQNIQTFSSNSNKSKNNEYILKYINIVQINTLIFDYPIFKNFNCDKIGEYLCLFIRDIPKYSFNEFKMAFDERLTEEQISSIFNKLDLQASKYNFSYSSIVVLLAQFALKLPSSEGKGKEEAIKFLFEEEFHFKFDNAELDEKVEEQQEEEEEIDFLKESETLNKAKKNEFTKEDEIYIDDLFSRLDNLPQPDATILSLANDIPCHSNNISHNPYQFKSVKFPLELLAVEVQEKKAAELLAKEEKKIARAKKNKKRNARDPPPKAIYMEELPNKKNYEEKYRGHAFIESLTGRNVQNTMKEKLANSNIYPSLILESLVLPHMLPSKVKEIIVESYKEQSKGFIEMAIKRMESARDYLEKTNITISTECQVQLFFNLSLGYLYESLGYHIAAFRFYDQAKILTETKMVVVDPDFALVYCFFGAIFLKLGEYEWSLRCYQKAKELREESVGGDSLDTAAVYNNMGVVCYYMESYLPAKNFFTLAYEITRSILGIVNPRTMLIKSNISKLNHLSFNKSVTFKTLSMYPTVPMTITNPKRKKGK